MIYPINHLPDSIPIGIQTEKSVEVIGFDLKPWLDTFHDMSFSVFHTRPGENNAYPVKDSVMVGTVLYWHPDGFDTEIAGAGKVEIAGIGDNKRKLSGFVATSICATSLETTSEPGVDVAPWYEAVLKAAQDIGEKVDVGEGGLYLIRVVPGTGKTDRNVGDIVAAADDGKTILLLWNDRVWMYRGQETFGSKQDYDGEAPTFCSPPKYDNYGKLRIDELQINPSNGGVRMFSTTVVKTPNPYKLIMTGAVEAAYDGSAALTVEIPTADEAAGKMYFITVTWDDTAGVWVSDRTQEEIAEASAAGKACILLEPLIGLVMPLVGFRDGAPQFVLMEDDATLGLLEHRAVINTNNTVDICGTEVKATPPLPNLTTTGYLRWNGSAWEAATIAQLKADLGL